MKELTLDKNQIDGTKLRIIREMIIANKGLHVLNMNHCSLGEDGASYIAQELGKNTTLKTLNLSENNFGDEGVENFAYYMILYEGFNLTHLDLSVNYITDKVGLRLAEAL